MPTSSDPIPVLAARAIANGYERDVVIVLAWSQQTNRVDTVTYGSTSENKLRAARLGEIVTKATGVDMSDAQSFEDFRHRTKAQWAQEKDRLTKRIEMLEAQLGARSEGSADADAF